MAPSVSAQSRPARALLRPAWLLALALLPVPVLAESSAQQQEALALAQLSTPVLRDYFDARRQLERRGSEQRLSDLRQLEDCLERTRLRSGAESCLAQGRQRQWQARQRWQLELAGLRQRYGLPNLEGAPQAMVVPRAYGVPIQSRAPLPYGWY